MLLLYDVIKSVYTHEHFITYSCVDMCEHTNDIRSHDHPTQTIAFADSYIINHSFVYVCKS